MGKLKNLIGTATKLLELNVDVTSMRVKLDSLGLFGIYGFLIP